jgi:hypothetical protein
VTDKQPTRHWSKEIESFCAARVKTWGKPEKGDYNFAPWLKDASSELLEAGCIYEYAREAWKLRCWLALMNESDDGERAKLVNDAWAKAAPATFPRPLRWLVDFANELADNTNFGDVLCVKRRKVMRSLARHPIHLSLKGIDLAYPRLGDAGPPPWPWQPWSVWTPWGAIDPNRPLPKVFNRPSPNNDGSEKLAVLIQWREFTDSEIGAEMKRLAALHRPESEPEPKRKGQKPKDRIRSYMKALSVLRIRKLHERNPWKRLELVAEVCGYRDCKREWAAYKERCKRGHAKEPMSQGAKSEMGNACKRALSFFQRLFPAEAPSNF